MWTENIIKHDSCSPAPINSGCYIYSIVTDTTTTDAIEVIIVILLRMRSSIIATIVTVTTSTCTMNRIVPKNNSSSAIRIICIITTKKESECIVFYIPRICCTGGKWMISPRSIYTTRKGTVELYSIRGPPYRNRCKC